MVMTARWHFGNVVPFLTIEGHVAVAAAAHALVTATSVETTMTAIDAVCFDTKMAFDVLMEIVGWIGPSYLSLQPA
jgi:hypothetical protein